MANNQAEQWKAVFGPTANCYSIDELTLSLEGRRGEAQQRSAEAHLASCAHCQAELSLFREFESPAVQPGEKTHVDAIVSRLKKNPPVPKQAWWRMLWRVNFLVPASVALAAALIATVFVIPPRQTLGPVVVPGNDVLRSGNIQVVAPVGDLSNTPSKLEWRAVAGASQYKVQLLEVDNTALWESTESATHVTLPSDIRSEIVPLKTLVWEVTALDSGGTVIGDSGKQRFRLRVQSNR